MSAARAYIDAERQRVNTLATRLPISATLCLQREKMRLQPVVQQLSSEVRLFLREQNHRLDILKEKADAASPRHILAMGYSITRVNGKAVRSLGEIAAGDNVVTMVADGEFTSTVTDKRDI